MKNVAIIFSFFFVLISLGACKHDPTDPDNYVYSYNHSSTTLNWTAYKYSYKTGVSGTFDQIAFLGTKTAAHPIEVFENLSFSVNSNSVNSNSIFRDNNIIKYFFNQMITSDFITGKSNGYLGDHSSGTIFISLEMNGMQKDLPFTYIVAGEKLSLEAELDLSDWNAIEALDFMEVCCKDLHTGTDGVHLLWPTVKIEIITFLELTRKI